MKAILSFMLILLFTLTATAKVKTETVEYKDGETVLEGYLAYEDTLTTHKPGILIVHEWWGLNDYPKQRAQQLAKEGYIAFCCDVFGKGKTTKSFDEAPKLVAPFYSDRALLRSRLEKGLDILKGNALCDTNKIAVIGYCFGGMGALELARSGANLKGVVSFHGSLTTPDTAMTKNIKAKLLICHGAEDTYVPIADVEAFENDMKSAKIDFQLILYSGAVHAFTNPNAGNDPSRGIAYNRTADLRSWKAMETFFTEIFK